MVSHFASPTEVFHHLLSIFSIGTQLVELMDGVDRRLKALEAGGMSSELEKHSHDLSQLRKATEKRFAEVIKQVEQLDQSQAHQKSLGDKNWTVKLEQIQGKVQSLEDRSSRQLVEIKTLQTQLERQQTSKSVATWDVTSSAGKQRPSSSELSRLDNMEKRYEDIERQVTRLKVHVSELELQLQASLASTYNGSFMWRIPELKRRKRDAIDGRVTSLYSPPFYTAKNGYKMCIRVYLNGDGMGHKTHLSLFFVLMKGEFDALLKWPFDNKVSLILVDQNHRKHIVQTFKPTPESSSFQRPITDMNVASGCPQFCKLSYLDDENYTKDDVLFIKCIVDTSHIFHP